MTDLLVALSVVLRRKTREAQDQRPLQRRRECLEMRTRIFDSTVGHAPRIDDVSEICFAPDRFRPHVAPKVLVAGLERERPCGHCSDRCFLVFQDLFGYLADAGPDDDRKLEFEAADSIELTHGVLLEELMEPVECVLIRSVVKEHSIYWG